eukprot:557609-Rhodomonas_salina.1
MNGVATVAIVPKPLAREFSLVGSLSFCTRATQTSGSDIAYGTARASGGSGSRHPSLQISRTRAKGVVSWTPEFVSA